MPKTTVFDIVKQKPTGEPAKGRGNKKGAGGSSLDIIVSHSVPKHHFSEVSCWIGREHEIVFA